MPGYGKLLLALASTFFVPSPVELITRRLMLFKEIVAVYCDSHMNHVNNNVWENEFVMLREVVDIITTVILKGYSDQDTLFLRDA
jgi:hypothetical protein